MQPKKILSLFFPAALFGGLISIVVGWLSDRFRLKYFAAFLASGTGLSSLSLVLYADRIAVPLLIAGMAISSVCFGPVSGAFAPRYFGIKHIGAISGAFMSTMIIASATGPLLFSLVRDYSGSYRFGFLGTLVVAIALQAGAFWANNPQRKIKMALVRDDGR